MFFNFSYGEKEHFSAKKRYGSIPPLPNTALSETFHIQHPSAGIQRVDVINILGVTLSKWFPFNAHIDKIPMQTAQSMYALLVVCSGILFGS